MESSIEETQAQINEVVDIMRVNVEKVLERGEKLPELDNRAKILKERGEEFEQQSCKLKRKYWWQNIKLIVIIIILFVVLASIVTVIVIFFPFWEDSKDATTSEIEESEKASPKSLHSLK